MGKKSIEREFIDFIVKSNTKLNKDRIQVNEGENKRHIRFHNDCGLYSESEFKSLFTGYSYFEVNDQSFSKKYKIAGYVQWNGNNIGVLFAKVNDGESARKQFTPSRLGLSVQTFDSSQGLIESVIKGLRKNKEKESTINDLVSLLENVIDSKKEVNDSNFLRKNKSIITSDFGEILAALNEILKGNKIQFPNGNNSIVDFFEYSSIKDYKGVSCKNPKGGGKTNVSSYRSELSSYNSDIGHLLYCISSHNRDGLFDVSSKLCPAIKKIKNKIGGLDEDSRLTYVNTHSYDEFYDWVKSEPIFRSFGIPSDQKNKPTELTPRSLWDSKGKDCLNPIDFTINTIIARLLSPQYINEISKVISKIVTEPKFMLVDIDFSRKRVLITEKEFKDVNRWKLVYWSRSTKAWHNWIAVEPEEGIQND